LAANAAATKPGSAASTAAAQLVLVLGSSTAPGSADEAIGNTTLRRDTGQRRRDRRVWFREVRRGPLAAIARIT